MELVADDLVLRWPTEEDVAAVVDAIHRSLPELRPWMTWATDDYDADDARAWIADELMPGSEAFVMVDSPSGAVVGAAGLKPVIEPDLFVELGYWVRSDATGRGLATRATLLLARHAIETRGAERVELYISVENEASRRVAEKAGAVHEGVLRSRMLLLDGRHHDAHLYSIVARDLSPRRAPRD